MPQWAGSCWYYLRFTDPRNSAALASAEALRHWGGPDLYIGGAEHAVLHLLYSRFWHKVLFDIGSVPFPEPFLRLFHQGVILGEDGEKMSKSRGNVVNPDTLVASHGADTLRLYLMFLGPLDAMKPWNPRGIEGPHRFLQRVWRLCLDENGRPSVKLDPEAAALPVEVERRFHETVRKVGDNIDGLRLNTAISHLMELLNAMQGLERVPRARALAFLQLLAPFAPHLAEELWERLGEKPSIQNAPWPSFDPAALQAAEVTLVIQINGRHRASLIANAGLSEQGALALAIADPKVAPHLAGRTIAKTIYVPGRVLNLVVPS
jgi:leucyl-tRNA synthetase